ncbi:nitrate- and nitrite sensing domain-containing protein [Actinokineospora pegani]|uniref:nitrate- and nitrite sensing domain-containing protein n=1 Tax=Actinokineospora pegani TaxID=2654637 RepID=UPI0012EA34FD|nr:nitrate- and nitrite sensing domain-containing protein [Actinokineospora pegani]
MTATVPRTRSSPTSTGRAGAGRDDNDVADGRRAAAGGEAGGRSGRSRWRSLTAWRDWSIPVKLTAVIAVPVLFAVVLGALRITDQVNRADGYRQVDRVVEVTDSLRGLLGWVQRERTKSAVALTGGAAIDEATATERRSADYAREQLRAAVAAAEFGSPVTAARAADARTALQRLDVLRRSVSGGAVDAATALAQFTGIIGVLLDFDRAVAEEITDRELSGTAAALAQLDAAQEEVRFQWALVAVGIARGGLNSAELTALRSSQARLDDHNSGFRAVATEAERAEFERQVSVPVVRDRSALLTRVLGDAAAPAAVDVPLPLPAVDWDLASDQTSARLSAAAATLGERIKARSDALQDDAGDAAGLASVVLILALVLAAAVIFLMGRQLLRSLAELRRGALDIARTRLPAAVARIRDGGEVTAKVDPIAVPSADEVGQVARAFDAVHEQALRLAGEQAALRANYGNVFVNLSRRSQGLVQRQLHLLERLERDEEDADQLSTLFQLDHLATRMRRNNENLMVLSGSEPARRAQQPAPLADLLRAAVSEIEQYQRVVIQSPPSALVVGYAVGDLIRLVAELLDNAAAFSAPTTQVTVAGQHTEDGAVRIEVVDRGIGMRDDELAEANHRLADAGTVDASTARRMGLFVVGRLAARHGVRVALRAGNQSGTRATVVIPPELVTANVIGLPAVPPKPASPPPAAEGKRAPHAVNGSGVNGAGVNGSGTNGTNGTAVNGRGAVNGSVNGSHKPNGTNGSAVNGRPTTDGGLPRRTPRDTRPTGGDGAQLPHSVPQPRTPDQGKAAPAAPAAPRPAPDEDQVPLPRRERPEPRAAAPDLFSPAEQTGWWDTPSDDSLGASAPPPDAMHETTPIFDEMVSAWFRTVTDDPATQAPSQVPEAWDFAADHGFSAARAVADTTPEDFTDTGLPRRTPRRNLVPGSVNGQARPEPKPEARPLPQWAPFGSRDAAELRRRLSSYQRGVHRARGAQQSDPAQDQPTTPERGLDLRGARFGFVGEPPGQDGLPQRTPRERLLPGSLDKPAPTAHRGPVMERDAEALRSRLGSLQRGIGRGRDSLARRGPEHQEGAGP